METNLEVDEVNYLAVELLERLEFSSINQEKIDRVEHFIKDVIEFVKTKSAWKKELYFKYREKRKRRSLARKY